MVKKLDELEDHYRKANSEPGKPRLALKWEDGHGEPYAWIVLENNCFEPGAHLLEQDGFSLAGAERSPRPIWGSYKYRDAPAANIVGAYNHKQYEKNINYAHKESSQRYLRENNLHDVSKEHLNAGREVFNEYQRTGVLPKDFNGITHPGVVSAVKEQIAHDVHENIGLNITRRADIQTDEGWNKAKESADQFDPQRYGRTAVEAKARHAADPTFSHDMYRLVDDLKKRPKHASVKGLNIIDSEEDIELLGRKIRGKK